MAAAKKLPGVSTYCNMCRDGSPADTEAARIIFRAYKEAPLFRAGILIRFTAGCPLCRTNEKKGDDGETRFPIQIEEKH